MHSKFSHFHKPVKSLYTCLFFLAAVLVLGQIPARAGYLYALNDNSTGNKIYGFRVNELNGALMPLSGFPVTAGSGTPNSTASERMIADSIKKRLFVINDGSDTVSVYGVNPGTGALTEMPFSPILLGVGTWNTIAVHPSGSPLIVSNGATGEVLSFVITDTTAMPAPGSPFSMAPATAFSSVISRDGNYFYAGGNAGTVFAGFSINASTGTLTPLPGSPFDSGASTPIGYAMDNFGRFFTINSNSGIRVFTTASGIPSPVSGNPFPSPGLTQGKFGVLHPNQKFYMVAGGTGNNVGVFTITGTGASTLLQSIPPSPFQTGGTNANNLAFNLSGTILYVGNSTSRNITSFVVNTGFGALTNPQVQAANTLGSSGTISGFTYMNDIIVDIFPDPRADFDGDGKTDVSVFRPSEGNWYLQQSASGFKTVNFGISNDKLVPADYDGDGKADVAVFRDGAWYILQSATNTFRAERWGVASFDVPVPADFDGDGRADLAVFRYGTEASSPTYYYILHSGSGATRVEQWGSGIVSKPVPHDYDGDGKADLAVYTEAGGYWYILNSSNNSFRAESFGLGNLQDLPVPGDYDGDRKTDLAVFRKSNGSWYFQLSSAGTTEFRFGLSNDIPVPGDYDGDAKDDIGVFRNGVWYIQRSSAGFAQYNFGLAGDLPIPAFAFYE